MIYYPKQTTITTISPSTGTLALEVDFQEHLVPNGVAEWLVKRGWYSGVSCPDTKQLMYTKNDSQDIAGMYLYWYEACAYEWYRMMSLGGSE